MLTYGLQGNIKSIVYLYHYCLQHCRPPSLYLIEQVGSHFDKVTLKLNCMVVSLYYCKIVGPFLCA